MVALRLLPAGRRARRGRLVALVVSAAAIVVACLRAATAPAVTEPWRALTAKQREIVVAALATAEPELRTAAAASFPGDRWSADDDFHNHELALVRQLAANQGVPVAAVWDALDEALRSHHEHGDSATPMRATAPPCHPRPTD
jgi:hypothetical protein